MTKQLAELDQEIKALEAELYPQGLNEEKDLF